MVVIEYMYYESPVRIRIRNLFNNLKLRNIGTNTATNFKLTESHESLVPRTFTATLENVIELRLVSEDLEKDV